MMEVNLTIPMDTVNDLTSGTDIMWSTTNYDNLTSMTIDSTIQILNLTNLQNNLDGISIQPPPSYIPYNDTTPIIEFIMTISSVLQTYYVPILLIGGSIGNILSVIVFFNTQLRKLSSSYYLAALSISDTVFLATTFMQWIKSFQLYYYDLQFVCQLLSFLSGISSFLSVWYVVAFTVERFIAVLYPLKRQTMCTVRRAKIVLCGLTIIGAIHSAPLLILLAPVPFHGSFVCSVRHEVMNDMKFYVKFDTIMVLVIPTITIIILNTITGFTVWRVSGLRRTMTNQRRKTTNNIRGDGLKNYNNIQLCSHPNGHLYVKQSCPKSNRHRITSSSQMKVTKMLLIISTVFVAFNLPSYIVRLIQYYEDSKSPALDAIQMLTWLPFLTNFGINFFLYCISGQNFRKAILEMCCKPTHRDNGTQVTVVSEYMRSTGSNTSRRRMITHNGSWNEIHELQLLTTSVQ